MNVSIREYRESDWDQFVDLTVSIVDMMAAIDPHKRFRPKDQFDAEAHAKCELAKVQNKNGKIFVAESDGNIFGYIVGTIEIAEEIDLISKFPAKQGYIDALFVEEEYRGKGVSSSLIDAIEEHFRSLNCVYSSVACVAVNDTARQFYGKKGYTEQYIDFLKKL